jgi:hypothetical protein
VGKDGVHVEDDTPERVLPVADDLTQMIFGSFLKHHVSAPWRAW